MKVCEGVYVCLRMCEGIWKCMCVRCICMCEDMCMRMCAVYVFLMVYAYSQGVRG